MKTILNLKKPIILFMSIIFLFSCSNNDDTQTPDDISQYSIAFKLNGELYKGTAGCAINDISSGGMEDAFMLLNAYKDGEDSSEPPFSIMLLGENINAGNTFELFGGFSDLQGIYYKLNDKEYHTRNAANNSNSGEIKIISFGSKFVGQFSGQLFTEQGESITITEGTINVDVTHF